MVLWLITEGTLVSDSVQPHSQPSPHEITTVGFSIKIATPPPLVAAIFNALYGGQPPGSSRMGVIDAPIKFFSELTSDLLYSS